MGKFSPRLLLRDKVGLTVALGISTIIVCGWGEGPYIYVVEVKRELRRETAAGGYGLSALRTAVKLRSSAEVTW